MSNFMHLSVMCWLQLPVSELASCCICASGVLVDCIPGDVVWFHYRSFVQEVESTFGTEALLRRFGDDITNADIPTVQLMSSINTLGLMIHDMDVYMSFKKIFHAILIACQQRAARTEPSRHGMMWLTALEVLRSAFFCDFLPLFRQV
ncbi:hypothetical protein OF83DRAFT_249826 [Amylostereum chailletii]|nr:hypothetical protein OF83DRAFT_249826 [Amylostereum chailletii]